MITNDITDIFFIPVGNFLSGQIWSVFLEGKLYLLPFIIVIWTSVNHARGAGADEGSPPIQAYRIYEARFASMFMVLMFAVQPLSLGGKKENSSSINVTSYSCIESGLGLAGLDESLFANSPVVKGVESANPTLWHAVINMFSTGITNASINSVACEKNGLSYRAAMMDISSAVVQDSNDQDLIDEYSEQCYIQAMPRILEMEKQTSSYDLSDRSYYGQALQQAYKGFPFDGFDQPIVAEINSPFYDSEGYFSPSKNVSCLSLGKHIDEVLGKEVSSGKYSEAFQRISKDYESQEKFESNKQLLFENTLHNVDGLLKATLTKINNSAFYKTTESLALGAISVVNPQKFNDIASNTRLAVADLASVYTAGMDSMKILEYQTAMPIVIGIVKMCLIIVMPIMMFFSGYNAKLLLTCSMGYFSFEYCKFFLEFGVYLDESISQFMSYATLDNMDVSRVAFSQLLTLNLGLIASFSLPAVWFIFCGWMGVKMMGSLSMVSDHVNDTQSLYKNLLNKAL